MLYKHALTSKDIDGLEYPLQKAVRARKSILGAEVHKHLAISTQTEMTV